MATPLQAPLHPAPRPPAPRQPAGGRAHAHSVRSLRAVSPGFTAMVVDRHPLLRESVAARLRAIGARDVVEAGSLEEARHRATALGVRDVCVLDLDLPDGSGTQLLTELAALGWQRLIVLAGSDEPHAVRSAFRAGAQGYLLKSATPTLVSDGVRRVLNGGVFADPMIAEALAAGLNDDSATGARLSDREVEVLQLVADGRSNKEIGEVLQLSALTVKSHLARISRRMGTGDRAQLVALAFRAGILR